MNNYIGKICPFCKTEFKEGDDIVVCSSCDMPHHKDCWIENQGCTTFGCMGTIKSVDGGTNTVTATEISFEDTSSSHVFCTKCGATYHIVVNPPKNEGICDHCGSEVVIRKDDAAETVRNRLKVYHQSTEILKGYYAEQNKLRLVEGNQPIEDAGRDILTAIGAEV